MDQLEIVVTPIERLIQFYTKELYNEIVFNKDSTGFWKKAQDYIFSNSLTSFREGLDALKEGLNEDREMFNYFSTLCFRIYAQPFTETALSIFLEGFDKISTDPVLGEGFRWDVKTLSSLELLLLFLTVHRNEITIAMFKRDEEDKATRVNKRSRVK